MQSDLSHLPKDRQRELRDFVLRTILTTFEDAHARSVTGWKKKGRIHKIVLYGSFARSDWVYEPHTKKAYSSDYDLMVIVNRKQVVENGEYWLALEERFIKARDAERIRSRPGIIVHTRQHVHNALVEGRYFFMDIVKEGILLYDAEDKPFPRPRPRTPAARLALAQEYFEETYTAAGSFFDNYENQLAKRYLPNTANRFLRNKSRLDNAAFQLHQTVENLYRTSILTMTFYTPHNHDIRALRSIADKLDRRIALVWPRDYHWQTAAFNILRDAYVKARYAKRGFRITEEQLRWLGEMTQELAQVVDVVCNERISELRRLAKEAESGPVKLYAVADNGADVPDEEPTQ